MTLPYTIFIFRKLLLRISFALLKIKSQLIESFSNGMMTLVDKMLCLTFNQNEISQLLKHLRVTAILTKT